MRKLVLISLAGAAALLAACGKPAATTQATASASPLAVQDMPRRKAGLWRQTVALEGSDKAMPALEACSDAASEAKLNLLGQHRNKDLCQSQSFSRNSDGSIAFNVACDMGSRGKTVSTGVISGDFNSSYKIAMESKTTGAPVPQLNAERKMTITATWIGACPAGEKGGDMILANGSKINLTDPSPGKRFP